jgi:RNA polymerase-interacting CarD/CdnL/TRCF family regulator
MSGPAVFRIGDPVFLFSGGLGRIKTFAGRAHNGEPAPWKAGDAEPPHFYVVETHDKVACVPIRQAAESIRPLVTTELAVQMLSALRGDPPPLSLKPILERGKDVAHSGSPLEHAQFLRELYSLQPLPESLEEGLRFYEGLVLPELERVLELAAGTLREELHRLHGSPHPGH